MAKKIEVYLPDDLDWFDEYSMVQILKVRLQNTIPLDVDVTAKGVVEVKMTKVFSDLAITGDRYNALAKIAKERGITVVELLQEGLKRKEMGRL